jgi:hypothetical protein
MPGSLGYWLYLLLAIDLPLIVNLAQLEPVPSNNAAGIRLDAKLRDD